MRIWARWNEVNTSLRTKRARACEAVRRPEGPALRASRQRSGACYHGSMEIRTIEPFLEYLARVRERTERVIAAIPADTYYPWQPDEVRTVAPQAVLMTLRWVSYVEEACRLVGKIARIVADNIDRLRRDGHPKWREVNLILPALGPGWVYYPPTANELRACVERTKPKPPARSCSAEERILGLCN